MSVLEPSLSHGRRSQTAWSRQKDRRPAVHRSKTVAARPAQRDPYDIVATRMDDLRRYILELKFQSSADVEGDT